MTKLLTCAHLFPGEGRGPGGGKAVVFNGAWTPASAGEQKWEVRSEE